MPKKRKQNFSPERSSHRPGQENYEKNSKKIQKFIKLISGINFSQNGMRYAEKEKTKFQSRTPFTLDPGKKIPKKTVKKFNKL